MLERYATLNSIKLHVDFIFRIGTTQRFEDVVDPRTVRTRAFGCCINQVFQFHLACGNLTSDQQVAVNPLSDTHVVGEADAHASTAAQSLAVILTKLAAGLQSVRFNLALGSCDVVEQSCRQWDE